jgi:hypothetical protein
MTEAPKLAHGKSQGALNTPADYKPVSTKGFYNPNVEMMSSLYMPRRLNYAPTNFIGVNTLRPDNMQPTRTYLPHGINGVYVPDIPIMKTLPVKPKFQ